MAIAAGLVGVIVTSPAHAIGEFSSGGWTGKAYFKSADFTHCAMLTTQGAWKLLFEIDRKGAVRLGVSNKQLKFQKNEKKRGALQVDAGAAVTRTFLAALPELVVATAGSAAEVQSLLHASRLKVQIGDLAADFGLSGIKDAFAKLSACAAQKGATGNPMSAPVPPPRGKRRPR
jgi:hypothetical protein